MPEIQLNGCTPEPLMGYLKALGVLRLVSEQRDPAAAGCWRGGVFTLRSDLDEEQLERFFLEAYRPTPMLAPWNAGSGFYVKWDHKKGAFKKREAVDALERISSSSSGRLKPYREALRVVRGTLSKAAVELDLITELEGKGKKERATILNGVLLFENDGRSFGLDKAAKDTLLARLRSSVLTDDSLRWLDAALALTTGRKKNRKEAPLLGSGGNVGNADFSALFAMMLPRLMATEQGAGGVAGSARYLGAALWGTPTPGILDFAIGQFDPGHAGGANQSHGLGAKSAANPWDYVLMCEGALLVAGAISRRTETGPVGVSFPFTVRSSRAGHGSTGGENTRGETWFPLWDRPTRLMEIRAFLGEGRAEIGRKPAATGVDFARAVAMLGVDRGISSFVRYGYQERLGQSYLAIPFGRFEVRARPEADLLREVDPWLERFRRAASDSNAPPRYSGSLRRVEAAIFAFCRHGGPARFARILCSLGRAERALARGERFREDKHLPPLAGLSPAWFRAAHDGSAEFDVALALAGIHDREGLVGPLRANLEPVQVFKRRGGGVAARWLDGGKAVVWGGADLPTNLAAVLQRRLMDGGRAGCTSLPLAARRGASLPSMSLFLNGMIDDSYIAELLWGLTLVDQAGPLPALPYASPAAPPLPRTFALLRLLFLPHPLPTPGGEVSVRPEARVLALLRAGRAGEACVVAARRLRACGLVPVPHARRHTRDQEWLPAAGAVDPDRLAAALLVPLSKNNTGRLAKLITRAPEAPQNAVG